jgi:hypothetical protein
MTNSPLVIARLAALRLAELRRASNAAGRPTR